jgi:nickel/cobalt exporter
MNPIDLAEHAGANPWFFLAAAFVLGALHGLEPGHSKGIMAAFMVGTRGTYFQAIVLALCATLSHTAVVWILALPASYGGFLLSDAQIAPYLNLVSGIVVLLLAYWMLRRLNRANHGHDHAHDHHHHDHVHDHTHDHGHDHAHDHAHAHDHSHGNSHDPGHDHAHGVHSHHHHDAHEPSAAVVTAARSASNEPLAAILEGEDDEHARYHMQEIANRFSGQVVSTGQVALFGLSSGLAPCSAAIVILITCFRLHQPVLGFGLVGAFSVGLGATLSAVALLASWGARTLGARSSRFREAVERAPFFSAILTAAIGLYLIVQFFRSY